jgi:hypothetical protein
MKDAYIVVEGKGNASLLKQMLPATLLQDIEIIGMSSWYAAFSLASTIMSKRSRPVILIVDAQSNDVSHIQERTQTLESLLLPAAAAAPYKVLLAVPSMITIAQESSHIKSIFIQQITDFLSVSFSQAA